MDILAAIKREKRRKDPQDAADARLALSLIDSHRQYADL
jgi:hypothetical protein